MWLGDVSYLSVRPIHVAIASFGRRFTSDQSVLDIGCGRKPYQRFFDCTYVGLDPLPEVSPDIVGHAWEIPVEDASFDGVILTQSLEHIWQTQKTVDEMARVLKPGGIGFISVPQTYRTHSAALPASQAPVANFDVVEHPYWHVDYFRFTKYGLFCLLYTSPSPRDFSYSKIFRLRSCGRLHSIRAL